MDPVNMRRREFLALATPALLPAAQSTDARIAELTYSFEDFRYRAPYKFGGKEVDRVTMLNVHSRLSLKNGKSATGFASMSMGNIWSFPALPYDTTLNAMKTLAGRIASITRGFREYAHPLDVNHQLEPDYLKAAGEVSRELKLSAPIPKLCMLVTASPFDAALHDAFGRLHGLNAFSAAGKEFVRFDLSHYLNDEFRGEYLDPYIERVAEKKIRMYHSAGASDPLTKAELTKQINDGLPETLEDWIPYSGVTAIKIKLNGNDLAWDVDRVVAIHKVTTAAQAKRGFRDWIYSLDFNERCPNVQYLLDFDHRLGEKASDAFQRVQYVEQPTARDLASNRQNVMFEAAKLRPVVIDESLTGLDALLLAREMGYTGVALKACKGQSQTLLLAAAAQKYKMFRCVQDLTCPGAALIHSVGIAAHIPRVSALEANGREYVPSASKGWEKRYPGIFNVRDGYLDTTGLNGPGLCTS
jgi:L-alanine-DL-glutamate epimerase-like enolase superfamily enzyme